MKLYIITHKKTKFKSNEIYLPIVVGANNNGHDFSDKNIIFDNEGDNISDKNKCFCELTGLYWIWKNVKEDIVGICHYRRYFTKNKYLFSMQASINKREIKNILKNYDIILPEKYKGEYNNMNSREFWSECHNIKDWEMTEKIISEMYPEYIDDLNWFNKESGGYCYNMLIARKGVFDNYCEWLFSILFEIEKYTDISSYSEYNKRLYGFLSERLINIWIHHNNLKVKEYPVYMTDKSISERIIKKIKKVIL